MKSLQIALMYDMGGRCICRAVICRVFSGGGPWRSPCAAAMMAGPERCVGVWFTVNVPAKLVYVLRDRTHTHGRDTAEFAGGHKGPGCRHVRQRQLTPCSRSAHAASMQ